MIAVICLLIFAGAGQAIYIYHVNKQLSEWLHFLKGIKNGSGQKTFIKGKGLLAEINYEINDILEENRNRFVKLTKAEAANKQIMTDLSHDVRTPLASLTGYLEALEQGRVRPDEREEYVRIAYEKSLSLKALVDVLFEWFKINANEWKYDIKEYDVNELTRQIIIGYLPVIEKKNINLEIYISEEEYFLMIDKIAYERIINNLLNNALNHGKGSKIIIKIQKNEDCIMIEVTNNGVTIPKEELQHIFDRLYKCDSSRSQSGNGLGLAITKELVNAMHGRITARSFQGETSFYITFPLKVRKK